MLVSVEIDVSTVYQWTEDEDDIALNAVTVGITSDTRILKVGGLQFGQRQGQVYWPERSEHDAVFAAGVEGPMSVELALQRADVLCREFGFQRVVLFLQHRELWDERWGILATTPSLNQPGES